MILIVQVLYIVVLSSTIVLILALRTNYTVREYRSIYTSTRYTNGSTRNEWWYQYPGINSNNSINNNTSTRYSHYYICSSTVVLVL